MKARLTYFLALAVTPAFGQGVDLHIRLSGKGKVVHNRARYACDGNAPKLNLPPGRFTVEYIHDNGDNELLVVPVKGKRLIFSHVLSADGDRFTAGPYEWWGKGDDATFTSEWLTGEKVSSTLCHSVQ